MAIRALTFDNAENIESRNDAYWYNFITKSICETTVGIIKDDSNMEPHRNNKKIKFDHGYVIIHGRLIEIDQDTGLTIPLASLDQTVTGRVIIRVDLQKQGRNQVSLTSTTDADLKKDDLNTNLLGTYEYEIGSYTADRNTVKSYTDKRTYVDSDHINEITNTKVNNVRKSLSNTIDDINNNYGIEENSSNKWINIKKDTDEFDENKTPNNKWYMIIYRENMSWTQEEEVFTFPKPVFFKWNSWEQVITKVGEARDDDASLILIQFLFISKQQNGLCIAALNGYGVETDFAIPWKTGTIFGNKIDDWIKAVYRWEGSGIPIIAGGNLSI